MENILPQKLEYEFLSHYVTEQMIPVVLPVLHAIVSHNPAPEACNTCHGNFF